MNLEYRNLLDEQFDPHSRVWIYQSNRLFSLPEALEIEATLNNFTSNWLSHGSSVKGEAHLFFGQFIVLLADETATSVGGCSTDSSVHLVKAIEQQFSVNLFDRTTLAFVAKEKVQLLPLSQLPYAIENGFITGDTLYFNNTVQTKKELETRWIIPVKESWLAKRFSFTRPVS